MAFPAEEVRHRELIAVLERISASLEKLAGQGAAVIERKPGEEFVDGKPRGYLRVIAETWEQNN